MFGLSVFNFNQITKASYIHIRLERNHTAYLFHLLRCQWLSSMFSKTRRIREKLSLRFLSIPHVKQAIMDDISVEMGSIPETVRNKKKKNIFHYQ